MAALHSMPVSLSQNPGSCTWTVAVRPTAMSRSYLENKKIGHGPQRFCHSARVNTFPPVPMPMPPASIEVPDGFLEEGASCQVPIGPQIGRGACGFLGWLVATWVVGGWLIIGLVEESARGSLSRFPFWLCFQGYQSEKLETTRGTCNYAQQRLPICRVPLRACVWRVWRAA